jgi:hypothetical protein
MAAMDAEQAVAVRELRRLQAEADRDRKLARFRAKRAAEAERAQQIVRPSSAEKPRVIVIERTL